jgi:hypothetical protein
MPTPIRPTTGPSTCSKTAPTIRSSRTDLLHRHPVGRRADRSRGARSSRWGAPVIGQLAARAGAWASRRRTSSSPTWWKSA